MTDTESNHRFLAALSINLLASSAGAQTWDLAGSASPPGFHQASAHRNMVAHGEYLFAAVVQEKKLSDPGFTILAELQPDSSVADDYYMPGVRTTLHTTPSGLVGSLDISFRRKVGASYRLYHQRLAIGSLAADDVARDKRVAASRRRPAL